MNPRDLMEAARALAESGHAPPAQARLRRAVSTAYYAMFHRLAASAADLFIGTERDPASAIPAKALILGKYGVSEKFFVDFSGYFGAICLRMKGFLMSRRLVHW